jgi:hypothetical protein
LWKDSVLIDEEFIGKRFGRLVVISFHGSVTTGRSKKRAWNTVCDCGAYVVLTTGNLNSGNSKSCGCLMKDLNKTRFTKHGCAKPGKQTTEYQTWSHIIQRCSNEKSKYFHHYGGRGITVCEEWQKDFAQFLKDMGRRPSSNHSIERIDNSKGYSAENCKWAIMKEQCRNKRSNVWLDDGSETLCLADMGKKHGIKIPTLHNRLKRGMTVQEAISKPIQKYRNQHEHSLLQRFGAER